MSFATIYVNGTAVATDDESEDMTLSVEFAEDSVTCIHCGYDIAEYATDDGIRWLNSDNESFCRGHWLATDDDAGSYDDGPDNVADRANYLHEPNNVDNPAEVANSAGVIVQGGAVRAWISVGEPRGAFQMSVWRGQNEDGTESRLLSVPYAADPMPHATLTPISDHTYRIGGERHGRRDEYATRQIDRLPSSDTYALQIESRDSVRESSGDHVRLHTHWMDITPEELSAIRAILSRRVES